MVPMPFVYSPLLWHGLQAFGMVTMPLAWYACLWHSFHAFDMVFMPLMWSKCLWHGLNTFGIVFMTSAWSPCVLRGCYAFAPQPNWLARILWMALKYAHFFCHINRKLSQLPQIPYLRNKNPNFSGIPKNQKSFLQQIPMGEGGGRFCPHLLLLPK